MRTLRQMLTSTSRATQRLSKLAKIKKARMMRKEDGTVKIVAVVQRYINDGLPHPPHEVEIESIDPKNPKLSKGPVKVSCDCGAFTFYGLEYIYNKKGAADIRYSNGKPPDVRNPGRIEFLCPHLTKLGLAVMLKGY